MNALHAIEQRMGQPPVQAVTIFAVSFLLMLIGWVSTAMGWFSVDKLYAWSIASAFLLVFALANSLLSLSAGSFFKYWGSSMYSYIGLALFSNLAAKMFSGIPIGEAGSYRWIFIVVTVGFVVFLSMVNFMKRIVNFAEREEWNQPRRRR